MMFRDKSISKLYAYALAAVFALTLAGCGGGGSGAAATDPVDPAPMPDTRLMDAQAAAAAAAMAANTALNAAKAAFNAISGLGSYDELHYGLVASAVGDAVNAKQAADAAAAAANGTDDVAAAQDAQAKAEAARDAAQAALANAEMFAGAVTDAKADADQAEIDRMAEVERMKMEAQLTDDLAAAVSAAMMANMTASQAARDAAGAVGALEATEGVTVQQGIDAQSASTRAAAAATDALTAHATAISAQNDRNLTAAQAAKDDAETAQTAAEAALGEINAVIAMLDEDIQDALYETQRIVDVGLARTAAVGSATTADADAMKAEEAATRVEAIAAGTPAATNARAAATNARDAANAAQAAHDAITDEMSKEDADEQAGIAANQAMYANSGYMTASTIKDTTETNLGITQEENRKRDIVTATSAANTAATAAKSAADDADDAADAAESAKANAQAAYNRAKSARTDSAEAKKQSEAANTAATSARAAANAAMQAYTDAKAAADGIDPDGSAADAQTAQGTAVTKQGEAEDSQETAEMKQSDAETAETAALAAAGVHVLGLLMAANPVDDPDTKDVASTEDVVENDENADRVAAVATALGEAAMAAPASGSQHSTEATAASGISVVWPADTPDNPDTGDDESVAGTRGFSVSADGAPFAPENLTADPPTATSKSLTALGDFVGVELAREPESGDNVYVHIYTDIEQEKAGTPPMTVEFDRVVLSGQPVGSLSRITLADDATVTTTAGTSSFTASFDHDDDGEDPITNSTFSCTGTNCEVTFADNKVTQLGGGWRVSGVRAEGTLTIDAVNAMPDPDYLTFGVWLSVPDTTGVVNTGVEVGAFSSGSQAYSLNNALTGSATYEGRAVGVKSMGGEVSHVDGSVTLNAKFGAIDTEGERGTNPPADATPGSVSGTVDIGGMMVHLGEDSEIGSDGAFNGTASAGTVMRNDDGTSSSMYEGMWGGSFYGATANDADTEDVNESIAAPRGAAGTFGVSGGEDENTMSLIGAFGARKK